MTDYFEYNSTIRLSLMSLGRSERSGNALSEPVPLAEFEAQLDPETVA